MYGKKRLVVVARTPKVVEDRREQIIDAALRVFAQKGFARATNKDIAREAGITPGLIYHYFESKEAVLKAVIEGRSPLRLIRSLSPEVLALPPAVFLRFLAQQALVIAEGEQFIQIIRLMLPELLHNSKISALGPGTFKQILSVLEGYLLAKMENDELVRVDAVAAAQIFISSMVGFVLRRQILRDPLVLQYSQEQIADVIVKTFLEGLLSH